MYGVVEAKCLEGSFICPNEGVSIADSGVINNICVSLFCSFFPE